MRHQDFLVLGIIGSRTYISHFSRILLIHSLTEVMHVSCSDILRQGENRGTGTLDNWSKCMRPFRAPTATEKHMKVLWG